MDNPGIKDLGDITVTAAGTQTTEWTDDLDSMTAVSLQARFAYETGGAAVLVFVQTSIDQGTTQAAPRPHQGGSAVRSGKGPQGLSQTARAEEGATCSVLGRRKAAFGPDGTGSAPMANFKTDLWGTERSAAKLLRSQIPQPWAPAFSCPCASARGA